MQKIIATVLLLSLCLSGVACSKQDTKEGNNADNNTTEVTTASVQNPTGYDITEDLTWESVDGGVEITSYSGDETAIIIPDTLDSQKVVSVGDTFSGNVNITSVYLTGSCKEFNFKSCDNLKSMEFAGEGSLTVSYDRFPKGLESLIAPKRNIELEDAFTCLKYLDVSEAQRLEIHDIDEYEGAMEEIIISDKFEVILPEREKYNVLFCEESYYEEAAEEDKTWLNKYASPTEVNEENLSYIFSNIFLTETIKINGTEYSVSQE